MLSDKEIDKNMDAAELEINAVLEKYQLELGMLYDEGTSVTLRHIKNKKNGEYSIYEREFAC